MENFEDILIYHFKKYPLMKPVDAVKLCYQSAFGGGHLVKNYEHAMSMLKTEFEGISQNNGAQMLEPIGKDYVRLNLHKAKAMGILPERICEIFVKSANCGKKTDIEEKVELLKKLTAEGKASFSYNELSEFLSEYKGEAVSHSEEYKNAYAPSYRVVLKYLAEDLQ